MAILTYENVDQYDAFKKKILLNPLDLDTKIVGYINDGSGIAQGVSLITVDGFSASETNKIGKRDGCYIGIKYTGSMNAIASVGATSIVLKGFTETEAGYLKRRGILRLTDGSSNESFHRVVEAVFSTGTPDIVTVTLEDAVENTMAADDVVDMINIDTVYYVGLVTKSGDQATKLNVYPQMDSAKSDDEPIIFGEFVTYDPGDLGEDVFTIAKAKENAELKNQSGVTIKKREWLGDYTINMVFIEQDYQSEILFNDDVPKINDSEDRSSLTEFDVGIKQAKKYKISILDEEDDTNYDKAIILPNGLEAIDSTEISLGRENFRTYSVTFSISKDSLDRLKILGDPLLTYTS